MTTTHRAIPWAEDGDTVITCRVCGLGVIGAGPDTRHVGEDEPVSGPPAGVDPATWRRAVETAHRALAWSGEPDALADGALEAVLGALHRDGLLAARRKRRAATPARPPAAVGQRTLSLR